MKHDEPPTIAEEPISNKRKRKDAWLEHANKVKPSLTRLMEERVARVERWFPKKIDTRHHHRQHRGYRDVAYVGLDRRTLRQRSRLLVLQACVI